MQLKLYNYIMIAFDFERRQCEKIIETAFKKLDDSFVVASQIQRQLKNLKFTEMIALLHIITTYNLGNDF